MKLKTKKTIASYYTALSIIACCALPSEDKSLLFTALYVGALLINLLASVLVLNYVYKLKENDTSAIGNRIQKRPC